VFDRKLCIPIALSVVCTEVARRVALTVLGVGLLGHFIVEARRGASSMPLDAFHGEEMLLLEDYERLVQDTHGGSVPFSKEHLEPVRKREILTRMLNNLRMICLNADDVSRT
jgi:regulator of sirC expression with transglutaminase-like and TPR domain